MALPFLKSTGARALPVERVRELTGRGFAEAEVIDILRKEGYSPDEIDTALTQVLRAKATETSPATSPWELTPPQAPEPLTPPKREPTLPTLEEITAAEKKPSVLPQIPETSIPAEYYQQSYLTEEYVDYVIQARLGEFNQKMTEIATRAEEMGKRVEEVNDRINEIMTLRSAEQTQILSRIDTFKESVGGIETRISGLERAFKETLPALIESVRALTDLVQRFKREI